MAQFNFDAVLTSDDIVHAASRPGYDVNGPMNEDDIDRWISFMQDQGIERIACLIPDETREGYPIDFVPMYREAFDDPEKIKVFPFESGSPIDFDTLLNILEYFEESHQADERVLTHCSAGRDRTGLVLTAWLVYGHGYTPEEAIEEIKTRENPQREPLSTGDREEIMDLLIRAEKSAPTGTFGE